MTRRIKVGVLISGTGTNLQALIDACAASNFPAEIVRVISNETNAGGLSKAANAGIPTAVVPHHDYPDRPDYHFDRSGEGRGREAYPQMTRFDWMQDLLEWFDFYLKGIGEQPGLWVEIQSNIGEWRLEDRYPPEGMETLTLDLGGTLSNVGGTTTILPDASTGPVYETDPLEEGIWIAGLPRLHVDVRKTVFPK